eukprot:GHVU01019995.1.p1 GENE.GHVU01019995.1~~GHVU01019995.1.p1  ORF type:complete len:184 (-),score=4.62 GHVU01019995.1:214-720(-)
MSTSEIVQVGIEEESLFTRIVPWIMFGATSTSLLLFVVGFSTPGWHGSNSTHTGLWGACVQQDISFVHASWFLATRAFSVLGLACLLGTFIITAMYIFAQHEVTKLLILKIFLACSSITFFFSFLVMMIFGIAQFDGLEYSYDLVVVSTLLTGGCIVFAVLQLRRTRL